MTLDRNIIDILECAFLICAGDYTVSEDELRGIQENIGGTGRILAAREAIELYELTQDIQEARKLFSADTPVEHNVGDLLSDVHPDLLGLVEKRAAIANSNDLLALEQETARKISDPFVRKVALIVGMQVAEADGELHPSERTSLNNIAAVWALDPDAVDQWFQTYADPVLTGNQPRAEILDNLLANIKTAGKVLTDPSDDRDETDVDQLIAMLTANMEALGIGGSDEAEADDDHEDQEYSVPEIVLRAQDGDLAAFREAWEQMSPTERDSLYGGVSVLEMAVRSGSVDVARFLLNDKADPDRRSLAGTTPLASAIVTYNLEMIQLLLDHGADPQLPTLHDGLSHEGRPAKREITPLSHAAQYDFPEAVHALIKAGAEVNHRMNNGHTALMTAVASGNSQAALALLELGADPDLDLPESIELGDWTASTPLLSAGREAQGEMALLLVQRGVRVNIADGAGNTALKFFAQQGNDEVISSLLEAGADTELFDAEGWGPLMSAAYNGHSSVVRLLLDAGANPNAVTTDGYDATPLFGAAEQGHLEVVELLLTAGADASIANGESQSALEAVRKKLADEDFADEHAAFESIATLLASAPSLRVGRSSKENET
ncbi:ankyrin repeat domain-containing protein [Parafrankia sp. BMG5.11]|uniref:ankyrin repeat domain-containing protein n=1 Tax=Parafrankia sp. BMG5.11 TaxID=222540 RepID=UPI0010402802|nr:ankyrin repeat domain-containing protein [Parafrankia sp. BMG5.11]TCJ41268.1 ankyrin repeat domain-containing protein [Parafrankia sp. BMG5.11]